MKKFLRQMKSALFVLYVFGFIFAFSSALPAYMSSSFLSMVTTEKLIGAIYMVCAIATLISFILAPRFLKRYGNYKVTLTLLTTNTLALLGLALLHSPYLILLCFIGAYISGSMIGLCLDLFIEHNSHDSNTGEIRSIYLTCLNLAWLISPLLAGILIGQQEYWKVFLTAAFVMIPVIFIVLHNLKDFVDPEYQQTKFFDAMSAVLKFRDIKGIFALNFLLQFFFAIMVIYTPIYLHKYIGFDWATISVIFTIMLLPFVLMQVFLGELADKRYGEKEMLSIGFIIMAISTALIPFISGKDFLIWAILLFVTRIGAAIAQVMCDVYFFKKIDDQNLGVIDLYRTMGPFASIFAPLVVTVFLFYFSFGSIFFLLGFMMLFGLRYSLALTDTK